MTCKVECCDKPAKTRGYCIGHYDRWFLGKPIDVPLGPSLKGTPVEDRLWPRVKKTATCWLWTGPTFDGYGRISHGGGRRYKLVHRLAYELLVGPIPDGMQIDHKCRVRHCVNPDHMQVVTQALNAQNRGVYRSSTSGVRGVCWDRKAGGWRVRASDGKGRRVSGGWFRTLPEAEAAAIALRNRLMTNNLEDRRVG